MGRHLELLIEVVTAIRYTPKHNPRNLRDLHSQRLMEAANNLSSFTGNVASLTVATEVYIQELEDMVALARKALRVHQTLFQESIAEYAMAAASHDE